MGSLSEAAKSYLIPWNGSEALKFITGQPQKSISTATVIFSACTVPPISGLRRELSRTFGGVPQAVKNLCCGLLKEIPTAPMALFQSAKLIQEMKLPNRFVRSATWEGMAKDDGACTPRLIRLMVHLAEALKIVPGLY